MKQSALRHRKMKRLARLLDEPIALARGIVETLLSITQAEFPDGDVSDLAPEEFAEECGFEAQRGGAIFEALHRSGWLDPHPAGDGFVVHDWLDHCENSVIKRLVERGRLPQGWRRADGTVNFYDRDEPLPESPSDPVSITPQPQTNHDPNTGGSRLLSTKGPSSAVGADARLNDSSTMVQVGSGNGSNTPTHAHAHAIATPLPLPSPRAGAPPADGEVGQESASGFRGGGVGPLQRLGFDEAGAAKIRQMYTADRIAEVVEWVDDQAKSRRRRIKNPPGLIVKVLRRSTDRQLTSNGKLYRECGQERQQLKPPRRNGSVVAEVLAGGVS